MEKTDRKIILRAALVIGIVILSIEYLIGFMPLNVLYEGVFYPRINRPDSVAPNMAEMDGAVVCSAVTGSILNWYNIIRRGDLFYLPPLILLILLLVSPAAAVVLNIISWRKNDTKKARTAAVLYLIGLNIPSAVLCFIGYFILKRENPVPANKDPSFWDRAGKAGIKNEVRVAIIIGIVFLPLCLFYWGIAPLIVLAVWSLTVLVPWSILRGERFPDRVPDLGA